MRMHPRDLEEVLSNQKKKSISVEDAEFQEIACDYLANQFFLLREPEGTANSTIIDRVEKLPELRSAEQTISSPQPNSLQDAKIGRAHV